MNIDIVGILVPIALFSLIGSVVYFTSKYNYQTKKAILESGGNIENIRKKFPMLEVGLTVLGLGLGLAIAVIPKTSNLPEEAKNLLVGACFFFFGGLGLISAFIIRKKIDKQ